MWSYVFLFRIYNLSGAVPSGRLGTARRACPVRRPSSSTWPSWTRWRRSMEWLEMNTRYHIVLIVKWNMLDQDKQLNIPTYICPISLVFHHFRVGSYLMSWNILSFFPDLWVFSIMKGASVQNIPGKLIWGVSRKYLFLIRQVVARPSGPVLAQLSDIWQWSSEA